MPPPPSHCPKCGSLYTLIACYGGFALICDCPPTETYLSGGVPKPATRFEPWPRHKDYPPMTYQIGSHFKIAIAGLGFVLLWIVTQGATEVGPITWSLGGMFIGLGISDLIPNRF